VSKLLSRTVASSAPRADLAATSIDYRWAAAIAAFGMKLRESAHRGDLSWTEIHALAAGAVGSDAEGYRRQALQMIDSALRIAPSPSRP
jgi:Ca-activated chloride channel family protein